MVRDCVDGRNACFDALVYPARGLTQVQSQMKSAAATTTMVDSMKTATKVTDLVLNFPPNWNALKAQFFAQLFSHARVRNVIRALQQCTCMPCSA
jgi:hypothetical protein